MKRYYNVTGEDRKRMVSIIGEVIGEKPYYLRMPTCGYKIGAVTVTKDGTMIWDWRTSEETVVKIMEILAEAEKFYARQKEKKESRADTE